MKAKHSPNMKLFLLLVPLLGTVLISGCTTGGGGPTFGNGVVILNWEPTFSSVESNDNLQLRVRVQNQGEVTAKNVNAVLTGINVDEWGFGAGNAINFYDLSPPDRIQNTAGQIKQETFNLVAPKIPKGTQQQYSPQVRVFYEYKTTAIKSITLVNENELRRLQDQGKTLSSTDTVTSAGPLKVTVNTGKFIKAREAGSYYSNTFPITIDIQNIGGGVVGRYNMPQDDYKVKVDIVFPSRLTNVDCGTFLGNYITLWKGQDASISCNVRISNPPIASEDENIKITLEYGYYIDSKTTVTVTGTQEGWY
jgi:hypothetical protein